MVAILGCGTAKIDKSVDIHKESYAEDSSSVINTTHKQDSSETLSESYKDSLVNAIHNSFMEEWEARTLEWTDTNGVSYKETVSKGKRRSHENGVTIHTGDYNKDVTTLNHTEDSLSNATKSKKSATTSDTHKELHKEKNMMPLGAFLLGVIAGVGLLIYVLIKARRK